MSYYATEEIFLEEFHNSDLLKEEVKIEKDQDIDVMVHKSGQSLGSFLLDPTEASLKYSDDGQLSNEVCEKKFEYRSWKCADKTKEDLIQHIDINHPTEAICRCEVCLKTTASHNEDKLFNCIQCSTTYKTKQGLGNHKALVHENRSRFRCEVCGKKFLYQSQLDVHIVKHNEERKHKCNDCDYSARSKRQLIMHIKVRHPTETPFRCEVCWKSFSTSSLLNRHSAIHNEGQRFQCDQCSITFKYQRSLRDHKAIVHENKGSFGCEVCGNKYLCQSQLDQHIVKHNEERKHKCNDCDYSAKRKKELTVHIRALHPTATPYECQVCSKSFAILSLLKRHFVSHNEENRFQCDQCSTTYKNKNSLRNHKVIVHEKKGGFRCEVCGKKYLYQSQLDEHMVKHNEERKHKCNDCDYSAKIKRHLTVHIRALHPTETPFRCEVCWKSFSTLLLLKEHTASHNKGKRFKCDQCSTTCKSKVNLRKHKAAIHENKGGFRCEVCGNKYLNQSRLNDHMKRHSKERKHKCSDCHYSAKSKKDLTVHIGLRHPTETPFQCEVCSKSFAILSHLKRHSVSHNEEKLFQCDQCSITYKHQTTLLNHKFVVHENQVGFRCEECGKKFLYQSHLDLHMVKHNEERKHKCNDCDYSARSKRQLTVHIRALHPTETPFRCEVCWMSFSTSFLLKKHSVCRNRGKRLQCDQCSTTCKSIVNLRKHKAAKHDNKGGFRCEVCGNKYLYQSRLNDHMKRHSKERKHKCSDCDYSAKSKGDLTVHIRIRHPTETPYQCQVCWKSFATSTLLKRHFASHNEKKLFKCDQRSTTYKPDNRGGFRRELLQRRSSDHDEIKLSSSIERIEEYEEIDLKLEPTVIYDPEEKRDISNVKQEPEVEVKNEPEYMEEM